MESDRSGAAPSGDPAQEALLEQEPKKSRRRLLALLGAGGTALLAGRLVGDQAEAGHDNTNVMHLGEQNIAPVGQVTQLNSDVDGPALVLHNDNPSGGALQADQPVNISVDVDGDAVFVDNQNAGETAGGISATARGGAHAVEGIAYPSDSFGPGFGVRGISSLPDGGYGDGPGVGVHGQSGTGVGVLGISSATGIGVEARNDSEGDGNALWAERSGGDGEAIIAHKVGAGDGHTIEALRDGPGAGVCLEATRAGSGGGYAIFAQRTADGPGDAIVAEHLGDGAAVRGLSDSGVGGHFSSNTGTALAVEGTSRFSTAGSAMIPAFQDSGFVSEAAVTADSHITATLTGNPGAVITGFPAVLHWVERQPGVGFVVHMTRRVGQATPFTYLIVEPG